jgi:hypothetical protein
MSCLRFKKVEQQDFKKLKKCHKKLGFELLDFNGVSYIFGEEPEDLAHRFSWGTLVSSWGKDPLVTKLELSYEFARTRLAVFGNGFGDRPTVPSHGTNLYAKPGGRGTEATTVSPAQDKDQIKEYQYYRADFSKNQLLAPWARKKLNELATNILHFARVHNPR